MAKRSGYLDRQKTRNKVLQDATLNDPAVMGKDVFGYDRLMKVVKAWGEKYDQYFTAMTRDPEADYVRVKMDEAMKRICEKHGQFVPFEERYDWLPKITYGKK